MKCYFCQEECVPVSTSFGDRLIKCNNHKYSVEHFVSFLYHKYGTCKDANCCPQKLLTRTSVIWYYNEKSFIVDFFHVEKRFCVGYIFGVSFLPKITPEEFDKKLPIWLLFS